jgi:hypothetical protein
MNYVISSWIILIVSGVVALLGLNFAARGHDAGINAAGWLLFAFGTIYTIRLGGSIAAGVDDDAS